MTKLQLQRPENKDFPYVTQFNSYPLYRMSHILGTIFPETEAGRPGCSCKQFQDGGNFVGDLFISSHLNLNII